MPWPGCPLELSTPAWGQFGRSLSSRVHSASPAPPRMHGKLSVSVWWQWGLLIPQSWKCACFLTKAETHLHNKQKDKVNNFFWQLSKVVVFFFFFSGWHPKNSVTPPHPGVNSNTGDSFKIQKGSLLWNVVTPPEQLSHLNYTDIRGAQARRWSRASSHSLTTKAKAYFLMSLHCLPLQTQNAVFFPLPTRTVISRHKQMPSLLILVSPH